MIRAKGGVGVDALAVKLQLGRRPSDQVNFNLVADQVTKLTSTWSPLGVGFNLVAGPQEAR